MATSSIFANFTIDNVDDDERFLAAIEASENKPKWQPRPDGYRHITNKEEIVKLIDKRRKNRQNG